MLVIREISSDTIRQILLDKGIPAKFIFLGDSSYSLLTRPDIKALAKPFADVMWQENVEYVDGAFDCDNYALKAVALVADIHRVNAKKKDIQSGIAFGELWVVKLGHAVCVAIHQEEDSSYSVEAYEPQNIPPFEKVAMTPEDWASVELCKFN